MNRCTKPGYNTFLSMLDRGVVAFSLERLAISVNFLRSVPIVPYPKIITAPHGSECGTAEYLCLIQLI